MANVIFHLTLVLLPMQLLQQVRVNIAVATVAHAVVAVTVAHAATVSAVLAEKNNPSKTIRKEVDFCRPPFFILSCMLFRQMR